MPWITSTTTTHEQKSSRRAWVWCTHQRLLNFELRFILHFKRTVVCAFFHIIDEKLLIKNRPGECKYLRLAKYWNALVCSDLFASYAILLAAQAVAKHNKCSIAWHRINEAQCSCCCSNTSLSLALSLSFSRIPTVCYLEKKNQTSGSQRHKLN